MKRSVVMSVFTLAAIVMLGSVTTAYAASTYFDESPPVGGLSVVAKPPISVRVSDPAGISTGFQIKVDGVTRTPKVTWGPGNSYCQLSYQQVAALANGSHTVYASVYTGAGRTSTTWSFTVKAPPSLGPLFPADNSVSTSQRPSIAASVTPNGVAIAAYSMKVDGVAVTPTYSAGTKTISYTPVTPLANDADHLASISVTDTTGAASTLSWRFKVQIYADMADTAGCTECHTGYPNAHPMTECLGCHADDGPFSAYWNMEYASAHPASYLTGIDCSYCHSITFPGVPKHVANVAGAHDASGDMSGCPCHVRSITTEHARYSADAGGPIACVTCHLSTDPAVTGAIASGSTACPDCHTIPPGHPYGEVDHVATDATDASGFACSACHGLDLMPEHEKVTSSSKGGGCSTCHPAPRDSYPVWAQGCVQGACHASASPVAMHGGMNAAHAQLPANDGCSEGECHTGIATSDLAAIHASATTQTVDGPRTSCTICHTGGVIPSTKDCADPACHPERVLPHGYDPAAHVSDETCLGTCHDTSLKPVHDAVTTPVVCSGCHAVKVAEIAPWDKSCGACHATIEHTSADHAGTDAAVRVSRGGNGGCSDTAPEQTNCHDIGNVSALHLGMPNKGCEICHSIGKTPTRECRTCHPQNDPQTYQSFVATYYPNADGPVVGTTVASSGTDRWDKVDEPNPGDADSTYFQFTTPGSAMFTTTRVIPSTATIVSVVVYARARTGSATTKNYYPMVSVGGTNYQRAATNIASAYTSGNGVAYSLATNPKTGVAWRPDELNATGSTSTLDYIGVGTGNASATLNQWLRVTQCYVVVNYRLAVEVPAGALLGTSWYHHNNVKYLWNAADAAPGAYYASSPPNGWNDALYYQDCYDFCHNGYGSNPDTPVYSAHQGTWMWYSTAGAYFPETRNLTLTTVTVPVAAPALDFMTNWRMSGTDAGYVEVSTNGGASYTPLTGTVGGVSRSGLAGNATVWVPAHYDLSAYAGQTVKIRFRFVVNDGAVGWGLDNLSISDSSGPVFSDDAETLKPDWTNYHWTRSKGAYPFF